MEMTNFWIFAIIYEAFPAEKNLYNEYKVKFKQSL